MEAVPMGGMGAPDDRTSGDPDQARRALDALAAADMGVWDWNVVTRELVWDERIARLHGFEPGEFDGTLATFLTRVHPEDEPVVSNAIRDALTKGGDFLVEFRVQRPGGAWAWVQGRGRAVPGPDGKPVRLVGVGADTTRLLNAREQVARTLDNISDGIVIIDVDWHVRFANQRAAQMGNRRPEDLVGRHIEELFPDITGSGFDRWLTATWRSQRPASFEAWYERLGIWFELRAHPSPDGVTLYVQDITARKAAAEAQERLVARLEHALQRQQQVERVVVALAEALTVEEVSDIILAEASRVLGTLFAGIALVDEEQRSLHFVSLRPFDDDVANRWRDIPLSLPTPVTDAVNQRRALFHPTREVIHDAYRDPRLAGVAEGAGAHAYANVPLVAGGRVLGALSMSWDAPRTFEAEERIFITTLAAQCAQAVERALLFARQHGVADTLQQAMLPEHLPPIPGADLSACYLPATAGLTIGGDWYDALTLPDGRVMLAVGDVAGHGVRAAAVMGQLRNALRGYVIDGAGPAEALAKLDRFVELASHGLFATVVVGLYDPARAELRFANAGHPPLLVRTAGGTSFASARVRPPLGLRARTGDDTVVTLAPGDAVVAYTDGLVERRREVLDLGLGRLADAVAAMGPPTGDAWCHALADALLPGGVRYDDVCILALGRAAA